jgi:phosphatidylinositol dimannoside acyltransferase
MRPRDVTSWKFWFYQALLPTLRQLGPSRGDAALGALGRLVAGSWPGRNRALDAALARARTALGADWAIDRIRPALAANSARFLARDYPLDGTRDDDALARFEVRGFGPLQEAIDRGRGAILVGSHLGGHIAALHWLYRRGLPLRLLLQRPGHVSRELNRRFDLDGPHPQSGLFLRRGLSASQSVERMLRARAALRDGLAVYLAGDVPWPGPNAHPGLLLGQPQRFLSVWADLAVLARAPVFLVFCTHRPGGRYALVIDPPWTLAPGDETTAVPRYLARLEAEIAAHPADAVAHLLWPCYGPAVASPTPTSRPSRRVPPSYTPDREARQAIAMH